MAIELATFRLGAQYLDQTAPTCAHFSTMKHIFICKFKELAMIKTRKILFNFNRLWMIEMTFKIARPCLYIAGRAMVGVGLLTIKRAQ
jgi:hypothetical protein